MTLPRFQEILTVRPLDHTTVERAAETAPSWLADLRQTGFDYFEKLSMPTGAEEEWRYVDLDFQLTDFGLPDVAGMSLAADSDLSSLTEYAGIARIVDGFVVDAYCDTPGVTVSKLAGQIDDGDPVLRDSLGRMIPPDLDIFAAAHRAFATDGLVLHVGRGVVVEQPIVVDMQVTQAESVSFPHLSVVLDTNAEVSVIVIMRSPDGQRSVVVPQLELAVGDGARLKLVTSQHWGDATTAIAQQRMVLGRDSTGRLGEVGLGGQLGRLDLNVDLVGDGSSSELVGLYFGDGEQVFDYRVVVNHHGKNTRSDVFLKGAVEDQAESVFSGLLKIWPDATRTSTFETNRNLVLSDGAKAHSVPNLEILCDDVICGHGSSVGPLEEEHMYYLMSRGLSHERAQRVLIRGFFDEMIQRLPVSGLEEPVRAAVTAKFITAQLEGRL
ncbi:MAG: Fe-S cluster assembly protein SufD [Acidimicrobiia bacterium]|nr:Fe-S cluster assembly protein SufD [Acidimicrobiia bacterium]